jgi:hypothetical protein
MGAQKPGFLRKYLIVASRLDEKPGFFFGGVRKS